MPSRTYSRTTARGGVAKPVPPRKRRPSSPPREMSLEEQEALLQISEALQETGSGGDGGDLWDLVREQRRLLDEVQRPSAASTTPPDRQPTKKSGSSTGLAGKEPSKGHASTGKTPQKKGEAEKRQRRFRARPPASFDVKLHRARTQRMIVLGRRRSTTATGAPAEDVDVVGSTGNVYTVHVGHVPACSCPDSRKGNECKHKVYALHTVLKAPEELVYQLALLGSELEQIFAHAPPIPTDVGAEGDDNDDDHDAPASNRKPADGECPICYMDLAPERNKLVWCRAQCGHNLHKSCFDQWAASQRGVEVRCVYCRTPWQAESGDLEAVKKAGEMGEDGYLNVAGHFGMSRARDYSGYYQPWARRQFGVGW